MNIKTKFDDRTLVDMPQDYVPDYIVSECPWRPRNRIVGYLIPTIRDDIITVKFIVGRDPTGCDKHQVYSWDKKILDMRRIKIIPRDKRNKGE